jgi:hypothetical protein
MPVLPRWNCINVQGEPSRFPHWRFTLRIHKRCMVRPRQQQAQRQASSPVRAIGSEQPAQRPLCPECDAAAWDTTSARVRPKSTPPSTWVRCGVLPGPTVPLPGLLTLAADHATLVPYLTIPLMDDIPYPERPADRTRPPS